MDKKDEIEVLGLDDTQEIEVLEDNEIDNNCSIDDDSSNTMSSIFDEDSRKDDVIGDSVSDISDDESFEDEFFSNSSSNLDDKFLSESEFNSESDSVLNEVSKNDDLGNDSDANEDNVSIENDVFKETNLEEDNTSDIDMSASDKINAVTSRGFSDKFKNLKVKYDKDPKKFVVGVIAILMAFSVLVGSSYAYLFYVSKTDNSTTITAGTLALNLKNDSNSITLSNALPERDNDGLSNSSVYEFNIENTGSLPASYRVTLDNTCMTSKTYSINGEDVTPNTCIPNEFIKVAISENDGNYVVLEKKTINNEASYIIATGALKQAKSVSYKMKIWLDYDTPNTYNANGGKNIVYVGQLGLNYEQGNMGSLDQSGANAPVLDSGMIPVYYDETSETWKKADENNKNKAYKWYDYDNKMWANSVTVNSTNRAKYQAASLGTTIPMDDILTMQVWIPRYKYKVWNYNSDGTKSSDEQQIEITFENGTNKTGEIECQDAISGTEGDPSETCKLKETSSTCTDATCNNKTYTHPAFTFGDEETKGFWIGKFELTGTIDNITTKPDLTSLRGQNVSTFEINIMKMNDSNNSYGLSPNNDTHMIKNIEWGAVAYLSHSKYGTCTDGTCKEVNINNSEAYYTGRSGGSSSASSTDNGTYKYNQIKSSNGTLVGAGQDGPSASTTHNIYGVYDMSGGASEYTMGNVVSNDGTTMMSGDSLEANSGYTGKVYDSGNYTSYTGIAYPDSKYYDKYSFSTSTTRIRSKLGDGIKEVYKSGSKGWYNDNSSFAVSMFPWFDRGGDYYNGANDGVFYSGISNGYIGLYVTSRLIITP